MAERKHALIAPSSAARVIQCPASVALSQGIPREESAFAAEGSRAHACAEWALRSAYAPLFEIEAPEEVEPPFDDEEMRAAVSGYGNYVAEIMRSGVIHYAAVEQWIPVSAVTGESGAYGTADFVCVIGKTLHIVDLKYGHTEIKAERNDQLSIYALGWLSSFDELGICYDVTDVVLHIYQPRTPGDPADSWHVKRDVLEARLPGMQKSFKRAFYLVEYPEQIRYDAPFIEGRGDFVAPGEAMKATCAFCPARSSCAWRTRCVREAMAPAAVKAELAPAVIETVERIPVPTDPTTLGRAYRYCDLVEQWAADVRAAAFKRLSEGQEVPGLKLVAGRQGNRKWSDEAEAEKALKGYLKKEEAYELKLIGPTKAEKLMKAGVIGERKWHAIEKLITRAEGKPAVALEEDPRPALARDDDFEVLE